MASRVRQCRRMQKAGGVIAESVYRAEGDPNNVLVFHQFTSMSQARLTATGSDTVAMQGR